ncbi:MAG: CRISPR-associated endoribonuclease Cas6 [Spirochaetota bacterium]
MRIQAFLQFENESAMLPPWYRIGFASMIKEALKKENEKLYSLYYGNNTSTIPKPFTFAVKLNVKEVIKKDINYLKLGNPNVQFYLSSNDYEFLMSVYNGLLQIKKYPIYSNTVSIQRFNLVNPKEFTDTKAVFDIFSPVVVRRVTPDKKGAGYTNVNEADYTQMLFYNIKSLCKFLGDSYCLSESDVKINTNAAFTVKIPHYNKKNPQKPEVIVATDGSLTIEAPNEVLKLIYDIGLGARRSQGFGMLEVV